VAETGFYETSGRRVSVEGEDAGSGPSRCGVGVGSVRAGVDCRDGLSAARRRHVLITKRSHLGIVHFWEFSV
jgi:hypothetical protein